MPRRSSVGSTTARSALPEPFIVEYAPTSRASCKRCQGLLVQGKVKVGKKIQSPFHDGFDVHWVHDSCATGYGLQSLEELTHWQRLKWSDILRLAKVLDLDAPDAKNPEVLRAATHITYRAEATLHLQTMGNAKILRQVLTENGIFFQDKWPAPKLAYIVADQILFGLLPPCPTCGNRALSQEGEEVRCQGYFSASTRCDFKFRYREMLPRVRKTSACPKFSAPTGDVITMEKLKRYRRLRIPAELQRHKAFASLQIPSECQKILGKLTGVEPSFQKAAAAASDVLDSGSEDEGGGEVARNMYFVLEGVDEGEASRIRRLIKENGGHVLETFDPGRTTHVVIGEEELYADPHGLAYDGALQHGLPIVMVEFVDALCDETAGDVEIEEPESRVTKGVRVQGRSGAAKNSKINGEYKKLDEAHNGRPAFKHVAKSVYCFYSAKSSKWKLHEKLDDNSGHLGYCRADSEEPPSSGWWIFGGRDVKFQRDPEVKVESCEIVEAPTKRESLEAARPKMRGAKLRQRKHLKLWKVDGGLGKKLVGVEEKPPEKKGRGAKRRLAPEEGSPALEVDEDVAAVVARDAQVYVDKANNVYHVMCTKTDTSTNVNKFYKIQVLVHGSSRNRYAVLRKWGRAIDTFLTKFTELTGTDWRERDSFEQRPGRYNMVEIMGTSSDSSKRRTTQAVAEEDDKAGVLCTLVPAVRSFISLIFDEKVIEEHMSKVLHIDMRKMPLGALSAAQLRRGLEVLSELSGLLRLDEETKRSTHGFDLRIRDATNRFYSLVPHTISKSTDAAARAKLNTLKKVEKAVDNVTDLLSIVDFTDARDRAATGQGHVLDRQFNALGVTLDVVSTERRDEECARFEGFPVCSHNRRLLWHGSRLTNWVSILSKGLQIAPKEAPVTGYMFGKGLYFADCSSKSANYCFASRDSPYGVLVLCEVALGDQYKRVAAEYEAKRSCRKAKAHSTWGMGKTAPDPTAEAELPSVGGVTVPMGPLIDTTELVDAEAAQQGETSSLLYNEFIVYNTAQGQWKALPEEHLRSNRWVTRQQKGSTLTPPSTWAVGAPRWTQSPRVQIILCSPP
ncbi:hypothetical protein FOZ60_002102 [Perkinsus olseni]|uniref:Poly [ADP-ribose] polymerase n=1 Tax=Perkinsus olseni TaxID=32597 RepID=A0A7J6NYW9_PEROL|nr:hypothetical protein FOZ60_002102 [Perkinsus olseni]